MYIFVKELDLICLTLTSSSLVACLKEVEENKEYIDIIELRLDCLTNIEKKNAYKFPKMVDKPVILTNRRVIDGGFSDVNEKTRRKELLDALVGDFAYVDVEDDVKNTEVVDLAREKGAKVIRSVHALSDAPIDLKVKISQLKAKGDIPKVAIRINSLKDLIHLYNLGQETKNIEKIIVAIGDYGIPSRILYKHFGSMLTFSSTKLKKSLSHVSPKDLKLLYRADKINQNTSIYGLIGKPVKHSNSPIIHNEGFKKIKFNAVYVPFLTDDVSSFFKLAEKLKIRGFSVTAPYKLDVLSRLGHISREVKLIGSCNTVFRKPNLWVGANTDYYGFITPILKELNDNKIKRALVIGAGGAAKTVVWALRNRDVKVTIVNRTLSKAAKLAEFNFCSYDSIENIKKYENKVDLIVQTTNISDETNPINDFEFSPNQIAYELLYHPRMTHFLTKAESAGCQLCYGIDMLLAQARMQFEHFTGYHWPKDVELDI